MEWRMAWRLGACTNNGDAAGAGLVTDGERREERATAAFW